MRYQNLCNQHWQHACLSLAARIAQELPDLNAVPNQTPFNYPSGTPISLEKAQALIQAGVAEAKKRGWPEEFAVVDWSGKLVAFARMDGAQLGSIAISEHKARAAAEFRRPTSSFETGVQKYGFNYLLSFDDIIAVAGGIPLVENGKLVGAIGCSGGTTSQDEVLCQAILGPPYLKLFHPWSVSALAQVQDARERDTRGYRQGGLLMTVLWPCKSQHQRQEKPMQPFKFWNKPATHRRGARGRTGRGRNAIRENGNGTRIPWISSTVTWRIPCL